MVATTEMIEADLSLIQRIEQHDAGALEQMYDRYSTRIYSLALFITEDTALAEEATHSTFMQLWERGGQNQFSQGDCASGLLTVARQSAIDLLRHSRRSSDRNPLLNNRQCDECDVVPKTEPRQELGFALNLLPPAQREVIILGFYRGLSPDEMADCLNMPLGTIKSHVRSGIDKLREVFRAA